ncbi:MAG: flagellar motor protein [Pseudomonadota bacterium]
MDILSIVGVILAFVTLLGGNFLEGGTLSALVNFPAAFIVVGGTFAAGALQTSGEVFRRAMTQLTGVFVVQTLPLQLMHDKLVGWAKVARREGLLGLENLTDEESEPFLARALELIIDGTSMQYIRQQLELESMLLEQDEIDAAKVYESMGGYAPTIGIIGAVMGLIQVMGNLRDPSLLGSGIALAFVATIYGVALANLFLLPVASKLRFRARRHALLRQMIIDGACSIFEGDSARTLSSKLNAYQRTLG